MPGLYKQQKRIRFWNKMDGEIGMFLSLFLTDAKNGPFLAVRVNQGPML
jgi:hypothetical protein